MNKTSLSEGIKGVIKSRKRAMKTLRLGTYIVRKQDAREKTQLIFENSVENRSHLCSFPKAF